MTTTTGNYFANHVLVHNCDVAEGEVMGWAEFSVTARMLGDLGIDAPKPGSHKRTLVDWFVDVLRPAIDDGLQRGMGSDLETIRWQLRLTRLLGDATRVARRLAAEIEAKGEDGEMVSWVRDNDAGPMVLKPVKVDDLAPSALLTHARKWCFMSATVISAEVMARDLGFAEAWGDNWGSVDVPMTFAVENRLVHVCGVVDMGRKGPLTQEQEMAYAVWRVVERHPGENVLVHCHTYKLSEYVARYLGGKVALREVFTYAKAGDRDKIAEKFSRSNGGVLCAPSMDRGVDFAGDACRVVVVAKVPHGYLGDRQISARMHDGWQGREWYAVQTVRRVVQMTGRHVRSDEDWGVSYVLDGAFLKLWRERRRLFPKWWQDAVRTNAVSRWDLRMPS